MDLLERTAIDTATKTRFAEEIKAGIPDDLPDHPGLSKNVSHAPRRSHSHRLDAKAKVLAIQNALRYIPAAHHVQLLPEIIEELEKYGRIYLYRYMPKHDVYARPISDYPARTSQAAAIMLMIQNNLDPVVAKHPQELITYGGNGAVFQNWAQYRLTMSYLADMTDEQTLVMYSGHPLGLFPSSPAAPRVVVTNGMMIPNYSSKDDWNYYNALGVTQYGQMTAGSFMYIGPQGIVHGTTITLLNAARLQDPNIKDLRGKLFITSGLGGMSGAQALAGVITGAVSIIAEVDPEAISQRVTDGYVMRDCVHSDLHKLLTAADQSLHDKKAITYVYQGNIVDLWEYFAQEKVHVDLGSDQTSLHNIDDMGYCPVGYSFEEAAELMHSDVKKFRKELKSTLQRHVAAVKKLSDDGMYFWDYGNAFLKEAGEADAEVWKDKNADTYLFPSYVEDIMGPMCFDYGFGPFRWVCCSGDQADLKRTDELAATVIQAMLDQAPPEIHGQLTDNLEWIQSAGNNLPIVGSLSRILYADARGRVEIALAFNEAIASGEITGAIVLGRDHHDVSGTDSPYRETANIQDGSRFTADMAVQNVIGDSFRGATWVSLHNGGGVGWGEVINGGFGMLIDGTEASAAKIKSMLNWDVNNGIARRSWARNPHAMYTAKEAMKSDTQLQITLPEICDESIIRQAMQVSDDQG